LLVDVGLPEAEVNKKVHAGDLISFGTTPVELAGNTLAGHTMDDRTAVAAVTVALEELQKRIHKWDVWAVATIQEEVSYGGGYTSAFGLKPDMGIAIDVTHAKGPGTTDARIAVLGKGLVIGNGPNYHPAVYKLIKNLVEDLEIPHQIKPDPSHSGTDAFPMQVTAGGMPTMLISIPLRYMHTPVEVVSMKDVQRVGRLLAEFITSLDETTLEKLSWDD
jgi:tetrahedral aminopeptidase